MPPRTPVPIKEVDYLDLTAFVGRATQAIAEAQAQLDAHSVEMLETLARTEVMLPVSRTVITQKKDARGGIVSQKAQTSTEYVKTTLLGLGIQPAYYQFSKTQIEIAMDISVFQEERESSEGEKKTFLKVNTKRLRQERRLSQDIKAHSRMTVEMVPVPAPGRMPDTSTVEIVEG